MTEAFLILNIADSHEWASRHSDCGVIPPGKLSTLLHMSRESAEAEALRLAQAHPGGQFCIFEATQVSVRVPIPTHVNLRGEVLLTEPVVRLASVREEVPF